MLNVRDGDEDAAGDDDSDDADSQGHFTFIENISGWVRAPNCKCRSTGMTMGI